MTSENPSSDGRTGRQRQRTAKGQEFAMDMLAKEVKRRGRKLTNHMSLFEELLKTGDTNLVRRELGKLDPMLDDLEEASKKLQEVANLDDRKHTDDMLQTEWERVSKLKIAVKEWLDAQDLDDRSMRSQASSKAKSTMRLTIELIGMQSRLENQVSLFEQLLCSSDSALVQQEFKKLEKIHTEMRDMSKTLEETLSQNEKEKVIEIAENADTQVQEVRRLVEEYQQNHNHQNEEHIPQQLNGDQDLPARLTAWIGPRKMVEESSEASHGDNLSKTSKSKAMVKGRTKWYLHAKEEVEYSNSLDRERRDDRNENADKKSIKSHTSKASKISVKTAPLDLIKKPSSRKSTRSISSQIFRRTDNLHDETQGKKGDKATRSSEELSQVSKRSMHRVYSQECSIGIEEKHCMIDKFMQAQMKLQGQMELIGDLLMTSNSSMMEKEFEGLESAHCQMTGIWNNLKEHLTHEEAKKMMDMIDEEDKTLNQMKRKVNAWKEKLAGKEKASLKSGGSLISERSKASTGSRKGRTRARDTPEHVEVAGLLNQVVDLQKRLEQQISLIQDHLLITVDKEVLEGEVDIMEQVHGNMSIAAGKFLDITESKEGYNKVQNILVEEEARVFEMKKQVIMWILAREETDDKSRTSCSSRKTLSENSFRSLRSKAKDCRSHISGSSRKTGLSDVSVGSTGKKRKKEGKNNTEVQRKDQLWDDLGKLKGKLNTQKNQCKDLVIERDIGLLREVVQNLEETYNEAIETVLQLRELLPAEDASKVMKKVEKEEMEIFKLKKAVVKIMADEQGANSTKAVIANVAKTNENIATHTRRNKEEQFPYKIDIIKQKEDEVATDVEGRLELKSDQGTKAKMQRKMKGELAKIGGRLENQKSLVNDLLRSSDNNMMNREMQTLDKLYDELISIASDLRELSSPREAEELSAMLDEEDADVFRVKKLVAKWAISRMDVQPLCDDTSSVEGSDSSGKSSSKNRAEEKIEALKEEVECMKRQTKAKFDLMNKTQAAEISKMEARFQVEGEPEIPSKEVLGKGKVEEAEDARRLAGDGGTSDPLIRLSELMVQTLKLQSAPKPDIDDFSGDPLEYNYFLESFKDGVEKLIDDPRQRLIRLLKYTKGGAKELIKHCIHESADTCYTNALSLLEKEYGSPFKIAAAYLEKLKNWPAIKTNDALGLRELYRFLVRCASYQERGVVDLNSPLTIRSIQLSLPSNLQDKWTSRVGRIRKKKEVEARFQDFVEFVEEESQMLNDPVYARGTTKDKNKLDGAWKTYLTGVTQETKKPKLECPFCKGDHDLDDCQDFIGKEPRAKKDFLFKLKLCFCCYSREHVAKECTAKRICAICGKEHPTALHEVNFKVSAVRQEDDDTAMCIVPVKLRQLRQLRKMKNCENESPSDKEVDVENVNSEYTAEGNPKCDSDGELVDDGEEIEVYAMLDECSTGTFIDEALVQEMSWQRRKATISVETVIAKKSMSVEALDNFVVRCDQDLEAKYGSIDVKLPTTYTQEQLPMSREDLPQAEKIARWEHLKAMAREIPEVKDLPLALLIGNNCPKALEPLQIVPSKGNGPYAKRTRLGWCVIGTASTGNPDGRKCYAIKVCTSVKDISNSSPARPHIVLQTKISDDAISHALQEMWRNDFVETNSEKKALSQEDKDFLATMREKVKFSEGHYELPLPLRVDEIPVPKRDNTTKTKLPILTPEEVSNRLEAAAKIEGVSQTIENVEGTRAGISVQHCNQTRMPTSSSSKVAKGVENVDKGNVMVQRVGRKLPVAKERVVVMPDNRGYALQRAKALKRRMLRDKEFEEEYIAFMTKLFNAGYAQKVPKERLNERGWLLPHHGVRHPTKKSMRVVLDCSAEKEGVSLNSKLMQGPDYSNSMIGVLLRFRKGLIPFTADIEAMYHQVRVPVEHRKYLRFLWWKDNDCRKELIECEMCVHPFGAISSKSCVTFALHQAALDNEDFFGKEAMETLLTDFYVDDLLKSLDGEKAVINLVKNTNGMCNAGGFNLTKYVCASQNVLESIPLEKRAERFKEGTGNLALSGMPPENALGAKWHVFADSFGFNVNFQCDDGTRRGCLATISRIKDALGIIAPFLLPGRKVLQEMTASSVRWDQMLPDDKEKEWGKWKDDLSLVNDLVIKRCYRSSEFGEVVDATLHCFSDASLVGYGVACYLRLVDKNGRIEVSLVMGKSRVSPLKPTTVPRLELTAAVLSVKLAALLTDELKISGLEAFYWIDNKIVLGYILNRKRRYRVFVANRVTKIEEYTGGNNWRYIKTKENPGDLASRGISPKETELVDRWLTGPVFLKESNEFWRSAEPEIEVVEGDMEVKVEEKVNVVHLVEMPLLERFEERISKWHRMVRVMAWILRFIRNTRKGHGFKHSLQNTCLVPVCLSQKRSGPNVEVTDIVVSELDRAETRIIKLMQQRSFETELEVLRKDTFKKRTGTLWRLKPFIDEDGVLRVGGRLSNSLEDESFKFPAIIPKQSTCTRRLIEWHHGQIQHRGKHSTVCRLRECGFWIINAGKEAGNVVFRCVRCKWLRGKCGQQMMADLPLNRTLVEPPFTYCGCDYFGPVSVKIGKKNFKRYGVIFTCFSLRAVHIELASNLETDSFIQALRRFIARRGGVREIRSDNGTNLVGADNELKKAVTEMDQANISAFLSKQGCDWISWERNTPTASHMGGVWERMIRTVRNVLMSLIKDSPRTLDEETLRTFLTEAEGIVNSRPLTIENLHDPESTPLTPNQILTMKSRLVLPPPGEFQHADVYCRKRWRITQHLANCFWNRWRREYLQLLQPRQKWSGERRNLCVDDVVLLKEEGVLRGHWPMGRVTEVHPSKDGLVRSVSVQVGGKTAKRPITKTVLLVPSDSSK